MQAQAMGNEHRAMVCKSSQGALRRTRNCHRKCPPSGRHQPFAAPQPGSSSPDAAQQSTMDTALPTEQEGESGKDSVDEQDIGTGRCYPPEGCDIEERLKHPKRVSENYPTGEWPERQGIPPTCRHSSEYEIALPSTPTLLQSLAHSGSRSEIATAPANLVSPMLPQTLANEFLDRLDEDIQKRDRESQAEVMHKEVTPASFPYQSADAIHYPTANPALPQAFLPVSSGQAQWPASEMLLPQFNLTPDSQVGEYGTNAVQAPVPYPRLSPAYGMNPQGQPPLQYYHSMNNYVQAPPALPQNFVPYPHTNPVFFQPQAAAPNYGVGRPSLPVQTYNKQPIMLANSSLQHIFYPSPLQINNFNNATIARPELSSQHPPSHPSYSQHLRSRASVPPPFAHPSQPLSNPLFTQQQPGLNNTRVNELRRMKKHRQTTPNVDEFMVKRAKKENIPKQVGNSKKGESGQRKGKPALKAKGARVEAGEAIQKVDQSRGNGTC